MSDYTDDTLSNPWDDVPAVDLEPERGWATEQSLEAMPEPGEPWQQRGVPPELRALGVERDIMGTTVQVVQVRLPGAPRDYTYQWWNMTMLDDGDGGEWQPDLLAKGDWVKLPGNVVSPEGSKGRVEGFGRSGYTGPLKDVLCRIEPQDVWTVQMEAVRSRPEALRVYRAAEKAEGMTPERLAALVAVGTTAMEKAGRL